MDKFASTSRRWLRLAVLLSVAFAGGPVFAAAVCDLNHDGAVDRRDLDVLSAALNSSSTGPGDARDVDGDGRITALDVRQCVLRCTTARCAPAVPYEVAQGVVGPGGGRLQMADGTSLLIPPNALTSPVQITAREIPLPAGAALPPGASVAGKLLSLEPDGLQFARSVTLTMSSNPALLPPGFDRSDALVMTRLPSGKFSIVGNVTSDPHPESHLQYIDPATGTVSVQLQHFSAYGAIYAHSVGAFAPETVSIAGVPGSSITIRRPLGPVPGFRATKPQFHNCVTGAGVVNSTQVVLPVRTAADVSAILVHSTNGGPNHSFSGELGWGADDCNLFFAHYYIDRSGDIFQIADDLSVVNHTANGTYTNTNAIGIELINNVGEPYDGAQVNGLVRLLDYLTLKYGIPRPGRQAATGLLVRNPSTDRIVTHSENYGPKCPGAAPRCDPIGNFQSSETRSFINAGGNLDQENIPGGSALAPSLVDMVVDALSVLDRDRRHTGVINTSGGDSIGQAAGGAAGSVTYREAPGLVPAYPGANRVNHNQLVVAAGTTLTWPLPLPASIDLTDAVIAGRLVINQSVALNVSGSFYLPPSGSIVIRDLPRGGNLTLSVRGLAMIQGLIDARGEDAPLTGTQPGNPGGNFVANLNEKQNFLVPAIVARGGDSDAVVAGGRGGNISLSAVTSALLVGGGTGPRANLGVLPNPPSRSDLILNDPDLTSTYTAADTIFPRHSGDKLPPPAPFNLGTIGYPRPVANQRTPLVKSNQQSGFSGGVVTSGGMGGAGVGGTNTGAGGAGGAGGSITIDAGAGPGIVFRDVDLISGGDVETTVSSIFVDPNAGLELAYRAPSGSLGGKATATSGVQGRGGSGGPGGAAGSITVAGNVTPAAASVTTLVRVLGFTAPALGILIPTASDIPTDTTKFSIGVTRQARDASGRPLYRLRLDDQGNALGGSGGIPGGKSQQANYPGAFGALGAGNTVSGIPK